MEALFPDQPVSNFAELVHRLGQIPLDRIRCRPFPGVATEKDVVRIEQEENRPCELVEGVLVEKTIGFRASVLAGAVVEHLRTIARSANLGVVTGADGMVTLFAGLVRIPDAAFVSWRNMPDGRIPDDPIPHLAPDLAVEVLSRTNTEAEMTRKRQEYFGAGVRLVWMIDPDRRRARVYQAVGDYAELNEDGTLEGGDVLPGFSLSLRELFAELDRTAR